MLQISALKGIADFWATVKEFRAALRRQRPLARAAPGPLAWMWERMHAGLRHAFDQHPAVRALLPQTRLADVASARIAPRPRRSCPNLFQNPDS